MVDNGTFVTAGTEIVKAYTATSMVLLNSKNTTILSTKLL
jgi:hypothetical protein